MKRLLIVIFLLPFSSLFAQLFTVDYLMEQKPYTISEFPTPRRAHCMLEMDYAGSRILNAESCSIPADKMVKRIYLVYSHFARTDTFQQPRLNKKRLKALKRVFPEWFDDNRIEWRFVAQTKADNYEDAQELFHGFVVTYGNPRPRLSAEEELARIDRALVLKCDTIKIPSKKEFTEVAYVKTRRIFSGKWKPRSQRKQAKGIEYDKKGFLVKRKAIYYIRIDTLTKRIPKKENSVCCMPVIRKEGLRDTSMFEIFRRREDWNWEKAVVVEDVTGSMYPYTAQMLAWRKLNYSARPSKHFVFFNDGDRTPDRDKVMGATGGLYHVAADSFIDIKAKVGEAMTGGSGGDIAENNLEAVLEGIKNCPECEAVIMIADNYAPVKDIELLDKIQKPVRIIVCGARDYVHVDYLRIARATKGAVHTVEEDLMELADLYEGQTIRIGKDVYKIVDGDFELLRSGR